MLSGLDYARMRRRYGNDAAKMRLLAYLSIGVFGLVVAGILCFGILVAWVAKDLPRPDRVQRTEGLSTVILDRNGETVYDVFENQNRIPVQWSDIPVDLRHAAVAIEDKDFYKHQGLSSHGIVRAVFNVLVLRKSLQSGSTLTQQLVKNVLLTNEQTLSRKLKEAILAIQIEQKYSKDEILQMYLNEVPYGGTAAGVEAAAKYYFDKHTRDLSLAECAILAGLPQAPSLYTPFGHDPKAYVNRTNDVLRRMREDGYITKEQETAAKTQVASYKFAGAGEESLKAPHFVSYVKEQISQMFGADVIEKGGLKVTTTLDLPLQEKAQKIVKEEVDKIRNLKVSNGAAVVIDPKTGDVLAMVGSKDYAGTDSAGLKFNVVTQGLRQPGSTMKPISYAAAIAKGYTAASVLMDVDTKYPSGDTAKPDYNPKNYDLKYRGPMQLRYALGNSINTIAVKVTALTGIKDIMRTAYDMGITTLEPTDANMKRFGLSITLGGGEVKLLEITSAFGVFANGGMRQAPGVILKVVDAKGKTLYEKKKESPKRVIGADVSYIISSMLSDNDARKDVFGPSSYLVIPAHTVAVKTGTTDDKRDNWTIGYTPSVVVGVWVGNNDNSQMDPRLASGITGAAPIWNRIMKTVLVSQKTDEPFTKPDNVVETEIDGYGGGLPKDGYPKRKEYFIKGTEPTTQSSIYKKVKISKHDGNRLANSVEIARGDYDTKEFVVFTESDPVSGDGKNRWQEGIDAWINSQSDSKFHPPRDTYEGSDKIAVNLKEPSDHGRVDSNDVRVVAEATSLNDVKNIRVYVNGNQVKEVSGKSFNDTVRVDSGNYQLIKVKAEDTGGNSAEREISISVNAPYQTPAPSPTPTPTPAPTSAAPTPSVSPTPKTP